MEVSVEITKSSDFVHIYAIGAIGDHSPYDFMIAFYNASTKNRTENDKQVTSMEMEMPDGTNSPMAAPAVDVADVQKQSKNISTQIQGYT